MPLRDQLLSAPATCECGGGGDSWWDEAREVFGAAEERVRQAMEEDGEAGLLVVKYDPASQRCTRVRLSFRDAVLRGAAQPTLTARIAAHAAPLAPTGRNFLASALHAVTVRRGCGADATQYGRGAAGDSGGAVLQREDSRTRNVSVRRRTPPPAAHHPHRPIAAQRAMKSKPADASP